MLTLTPWRRPFPCELEGVSEPELLACARRLGSFDASELRQAIRGYLDVLDLVLPCIEQIVAHLVEEVPDHYFVFFGRDADPLYDAMATIVTGTPLERRVSLMNFGSLLRSKMSIGDPETRVFVNQYVDFEAIK